MEEFQKLAHGLPKTPNDLADFIYTFGLNPRLIIVHYLSVALSMRKISGSVDHARNHPFASLFVFVTSCSGGTAIMSFLLGRPVVAIYLNTHNVMLASLVWYLMLFSPFDIVAKFSHVKLVKIILLCLKELHRARSILDGINISSGLYPGKMLVIVLMGSVRGSGAKFVLRPLDSFVRGHFVADNEFLRPTFSTKHAVVTSILIYLVRVNVIEFDERMLICILTVIAALVQVCTLLIDLKDPYAYLEDVFCAIFLRFPKEIVTVDHKKKTS